ncbi:hypothetical protein ACWKSP_22165 [Micromonosporaceae bacterium Da 78-11]
MTLRLIDLMCSLCAGRILQTGVWTPPRNCGICATSGAEQNLASLGARESAAVHEAGHAVAGLACEYTIGYVALESSGRPGSSAHYTAQIFDYQVGSSGHAVMALAGAAAGRRWVRDQGYTSDAYMLEVANTGLSDVTDMYALDWTHGDLANRAVDAAAVVDQHWLAIERVAESLVVRGRLSGDEVADLADMCGSTR